MFISNIGNSNMVISEGLVRPIKNFTDLDIWQKSHLLTLLVYKLVTKFPKEERYALSDQIRRAVVSIESNIAEGFSRYGKLEKRQFYAIARGSLTEVQCQAMIARDLHFIQTTDYEEIEALVVVINKMFTSILKRIQSW